MLEHLFTFVFEFAFAFTGHLLLWALTLGRYDVANGQNDVATVVGILFWIAVGVGVWFAFFR